MVEHLPLAQGVVPGLQDRVPHWALCMAPASPPSAYVSASLCVSLVHKYIFFNLAFLCFGKDAASLVYFVVRSYLFQLIELQNFRVG